MTVVTMNHVRTTRHRRVVLDDICMRVRPGTVYGLLSPNGAGKSTTLTVLVGSLSPSSGTVELFGEPWRRSALTRVGASVDGPAFYPHLSGQANLRLHADLLGLDDDAVDAALAEVGLSDAARTRSSRYSTGMRSRLATAIALLGDPELLVLDEPHNGLDPDGIRWLRSLIRRRAESGTTVLLSSHLLGEVTAVADDIGCVVAGRTVFEGSLSGFAPDGDCERAYFDVLERGSVAAGAA
jgi:ABC-2 type transport system ATP-binding protein